jgi:hypothetical protein
MFQTEQSIIGLIQDLITSQKYTNSLCLLWDPTAYKYHYNGIKIVNNEYK